MVQGLPSGGHSHNCDIWIILSYTENHVIGRWFLLGFWGLLKKLCRRYQVFGCSSLPIIINIPNHIYSSWDQHIFISRKQKLSEALIWTLYLFLDWKRFLSFVQILAVNWRCRFPSILSTFGWNSYYGILGYSNKYRVK